MSSIDVFGAIYVPVQLEVQATTVLTDWFPTYIREIESQQSMTVGQLTPPKSYTNRNKLDSLPGEELPKVVVISPGLIGAPKKKGDKTFRATWRLGVGVATAEKDEETASTNSKIYGAAARTIILQKLGKAVKGNVEWLDEQYVDLPISSQLQQYRAAAIWFSVEIENIVTQKPGPDAPDTDPYSYGIAELVSVTLKKEPVNG